MAGDIVYFDLETRRTANDVGGWHNKHEMGISVAVTYSTKLGEYIIYTEEMTGELIEQLRRADLVVGVERRKVLVERGRVVWRPL